MTLDITLTLTELCHTGRERERERGREREREGERGREKEKEGEANNSYIANGIRDKTHKHAVHN